MAFFKKKPDPISDRSRVLTAEIAALEAQIKELNAKVEEAQLQPRLRSTALPQGSANPAAAGSDASADLEAQDPIFEPVDQRKISGGLENDATPEHFNDLGVRKYDLAGLWRRLQSQFRGPTAHNPKLISYLAAGAIRGLRPLRYEKRVARNRFLGFFLVLLLLLIGIVSAFMRRR